MSGGWRDGDCALLMIAFALQLFLPGWEIGFSPMAILTAFLCSTFTGILFGWLPARNAARLDPVDALAGSNETKMPADRAGILRGCTQ
ncbi:hypothetical protein ACNKHO_05440 [Shigella flexneri]